MPRCSRSPPGIDTVLVLRTALSEGSRQASSAALGIVTGCLIWGLTVAIGLGVLLAASPLLFELIKLAGALYLIWLGCRMFVRPRQIETVGADAVARTPGGSWVFRGLATNLLNPKAVIFYLSLLPHFVPPAVNVPLFTMLLACIHAALGIAWFALLIAATRPFARFLSDPRIIARLDRLTGGLLVAAGAKIGIDTLRELRI